MCHWSIMNTRMPQQQTQMPCKIIMEINQPRQEIYSCPYHDRIGINQGEKKLLTGSQRVWKKLFISSEWDAGVFTRNLCFMASEEPQFVLLPRTYSHSHCGPGVKLFSGKAQGQGLGTQRHGGTSTCSGRAALFNAFTGNFCMKKIR